MARSILYLMLFASLVLASIIIGDPSNIVPPEDWADDNAYVFDWHTTGEAYQTIPVIGPYTYNQQTGAIDHRSLETTANDTSVVVIANRSDVTITHSTITKFGYSSALNQASFYGVNAAVNNANHSTLRLSNVNVTTHNGAANVYTYGTGSVTYADNTWLYSSGPVSHGFYAAGNGTIYAKDVQVYSGGTRCSAFSGDYPAGYIHAENAVIHTDGVGSAICFLQGLCNMTNVVGYAAKSPAMISDGALSDVMGIWKNSDLTAGLLGGIVMISDSTIRNGTTVVLDNTRLTVLGEENPGLWFGNINATVDLIAASINTSSGILAVSNYSFLTQDFDYYAGYEENNNLSPAQATINVKDSTLSGSLVAYNESSISFNLQSFSHWNGMAKVGLGSAYLSVSLDNTSTWTLTGDSVLQSFANSNSTLANVFSNGFDILYDSDSLVNAAWKGETYELQGGGKLRPS
ncbi:uncharacterized protein BO88DRAFT_426879 [Aspergillus vadensis CBS 113365]|uniref:Uncharacterized protein n=1 Tax=Aspergillus vadensis (strain CBS 113365 / IMI 142717 / IBT 24658) TaxID=1448311 RepID=A0A319B5F6_ASPVC|nr:hypothetical protein BO88DRAFT_426879 [Aspergillus vadensis CBS 113365]PYH67655.1 hypothetical protein BO88DRAFT_426879 [Aspergillus vadensis CBS 113365]